MILSDRIASRMNEGSSGRLLEGEEAAVTMLDVLQDEQELEDDANVSETIASCAVLKGLCHEIYILIRTANLNQFFFYVRLCADKC
jgi:hypothetical protein